MGDVAAQQGATGEREPEATQLLRATLREFVEQEVRPLIVESEREERLPDSVFAGLRGLGVLGGVIPESYGGSGLSYCDFVVVVEELSRLWQSLGSLVAMASGPVGHALLHFGNDAQRERFLVPLARGEVIAGFGLSEPEAGTDAAAMRARARRDGENWVLDGRKSWIDWAGNGDFFVVLAKTDPEQGVRGVSAFLVERGAPGFSTTVERGKLGMRALTVGDLVFESCVLPADRLLGDEGKGFRVAMSALEDARLGVAARLCGGLRGCLEESTAQARNRHVFGRPLGEYQLTQTKIADMHLSLEAAVLLTRHAAELKDAGGDATLAVLTAKLFAQERFMAAAHDAVQLFGANGVSDEYPVNRFFRDAKVSEITGGTNEILRILIAERVIGLQ